MIKNLIFACIAFACATSFVHCAPRGYEYEAAAPTIQQVSLEAIPDIAKYLNNAYSAPSNSYSPSISVVPPQASYESVPSPKSAASSSAQPYPNYNKSYWATQPTYSRTIYPGQQNYKAYASPTQRKTVSLPILPDNPVAKLQVPQNSYSSSYTY